MAEPELGHTYAQSIREGGVTRALVVCGEERLDEISCAGRTHVWELKDGQITEGTVSPEDFGLSAHPLTDVAGGTPEQNAETFRTLLTSGANIPNRLKPILDFVLINAAALLVVAGVARNDREGVALGLESIKSGKAWAALNQFKEEGRRAGINVTS